MNQSEFIKFVESMSPSKFMEVIKLYNEIYDPIEEKTWYEDGHKYTKFIQYERIDAESLLKYREINFRDDKVHGLVAVWREDGTKGWEDRYDSGLLHGLCVEYNENGKKACEVNFKNGKRNGLTIFFDEDENVTFEELCQNGEVISQKYYENGNLVEDLYASDSEPLVTDYYDHRGVFFWG